MSETIGQRPWMTAPETAAVLDALEAAGGPDCARFVGGAVRNALIGRPVDEVDIATTLTPDRVTGALQAAGLKAVPTGVEHGTVTAVSGGKPFEVTTLRRDVATDGRIVSVGEPEHRVREDYLRILRFFRFLAWYGSGPPDAAALAACESLKGQLKTLSAERVSRELLKLLAAEDPREAVALMARAGVLGEVLPAPIDLDRFNGLVAIEADQLFENDPVLRLAALLPDDQIGAVQCAERLRLSNAERDRIAAALAPTPAFKSWMSPREIRRTLYRLGAEVFRDRAKLAWARAERTATTPQWRGMIALGEGWTAPAFPLTGEDVIAAGVPKGPMVGQVLREVEDWWIDHDFIDDKLSAVEKLKSATGSSPSTRASCRRRPPPATPI